MFLFNLLLIFFLKQPSKLFFKYLFFFFSFKKASYFSMSYYYHLLLLLVVGQDGDGVDYQHDAPGRRTKIKFQFFRMPFARRGRFVDNYCYSSTESIFK